MLWTRSVHFKPLVDTAEEKSEKETRERWNAAETPCLIQHFSCSTLRGLLCLIFRFIMLPLPNVFIRRWADLDWRQASLAPELWNKQDLFWKSWMAACCSRTCTYCSALTGPSQICKWLMPCALVHLHTVRHAGCWTLRWFWTFWMVSPTPLPLRWWFPKRI